MTRTGSLALLLSLVLCGVARAETPGEKVVRLMDEAFSLAKDQYFEYDVITTQPGKSPSKLTMKTWIKGKYYRLIEYTSPGDIKGMKVLVLSLDQLYVYLPAFRKVRRVAAHAREQSYMGTALSQDDTAITVYGEYYHGKLVGETKTTWKVQTTRRPGKTHPYARIDFEVSKQYHHPVHVDYYSDKGVKVKSEDRLEYSCLQNICNGRRMIMTDHTRNNLSTELVRTAWKVNTGVPESMFTTRALQRGE